MRATKITIIVGLGLTIAFAGASAQTDGLYVVLNAVGINTDTPTEPLHVAGSDGTTKILIDESAASTERRTLLSMQNNGQVVMEYADTSNDNSWLFATRGLGFEINRAGTGITEFLMRSNGNLEIAGTLTQGSSRAWKHKITAVEGDDILDRVLELPISSWQYDRDEADGFHLGPMAEDFHSVFKLGRDDKHLAPADVAGVALAAIQGLNGRIQARDEQIAKLEANNAEMRAELDELKRLVKGLAAN